MTLVVGGHDKQIQPMALAVVSHPTNSFVGGYDKQIQPMALAVGEPAHDPVVAYNKKHEVNPLRRP